MADTSATDTSATGTSATDTSATDTSATGTSARDTLIADTEEEINFNYLSNDADNATLAFFSNPIYLGMIKKREKLVDNNKEYKKNIKFYRKRLISLFKDMIKDDDSSPPPTQELKEMYNRFIHTAINYFQIIDKKDIIQEQHMDHEHMDHEHMDHEHMDHEHMDQEENTGLDETMNDIDAENLTVNEANDRMMKKTIQVASLDNYVINKHDNSSTEFRIIPLKLEIDLNTPAHKTKGVKLKTKIKKNKEEDLSQ
jgi:hypothetical protein